MAGGVEKDVGFECSEALVEQVMLKVRMLRAESFGEGAGLGGLRAGRAVGVERMAGDKDSHVVLADEAGDGLQVGALGGAVDREQGLRGEVELIADGESDPAVADVQRESAGHGFECSGQADEKRNAADAVIARARDGARDEGEHGRGLMNAGEGRRLQRKMWRGALWSRCRLHFLRRCLRVRVLGWLFLLVVVLAGVEAYRVLVPFGPGRETFVEIAPGTGTAQIAEQLREAGVIRSRLAFEALKAYRGGVLKAGEYRFDHPATLSEVYGRITRGDVYARTLLIPEGYNIFDIAQAVEQAGLGSRAAFLKAEMSDTALIGRWSPHANSLEGYLFPDTYRFSPRLKPEAMLATMVKRFGVAAARLGLKADQTERIVTMASLVEKEVHADTERAQVASVFENRLKAGMPLQTDPAVAYASLLRGTWTGVIHQSELHSDSTYNTYVHAGLPPGPICNPGMAALTAAMHPAQTEYLYFVADANGGTKFSRTLAEHAGHVEEYRRAGR